MKRVVLLILLLLGGMCEVWAQRSEAVSMPMAWGTLHGTLWSPEEPTSRVAILLAGSGPTDRYGNSAAGLMTNAYRYLAEELTQMGWAALSYDKRGIAQSRYNDPAAMVEDARFEHFVEDAERWVEAMHERGYQEIVLIGHSKGALVAFLAAERNKRVDGVVSLAGAGFPIDEILKVQLTGQLLAVDYTLYGQACRILDQLKRGETPTEVPPMLKSLFPPYLNRLYTEWMSHDPREVVARLTCPLLFVSGDADLQVSPKNLEALHQAAPTAAYHLIPKMCHTLKPTEGKTLQAQQAAYLDGTLSLSEELCEVLRDFLF